MANELTQINTASLQASAADTQKRTTVDEPVRTQAGASETVDAAEFKPRDVELALGQLQEFASSMQRNLDFSIDDGSGRSVIRVVDGETDELIRQIPTEEAISIAQNIERIKGVLFEDKA